MTASCFVSSARDISAVVREGSTATVFARVSSPVSTGSATGVPGEGNWTMRADLSSISYVVYDETSEEQSVSSTSITVSSAIVDTPVTSNANWPNDSTGYNFTHAVPSSAFRGGCSNAMIEYTFTYTNGNVDKLVIKCVVKTLRGS